MRKALRVWTLAAVAGLSVAGVVAERPASAQNTYLDAPFQQGSLRYRPSGARPPRTTVTRPRRRFAPGRRYYYGPVAGGYAAQPRVYYAPQAPVAAPRSYYYRPY